MKTLCPPAVSHRQ